MNAPPNIGLVSAHSGSDDVVNWLTNETRDERFLDNIFAELCVRLQRANIPVKRATLHILIHHPQWLGARFVWADGMREAEIARQVRPAKSMKVRLKCTRISNAILRWAASTPSMERCGRRA
jgi:hypothetical protein